MSKSVPAIVTPEVLRWARELDNISLEEVARKIKVDVSKVEAWERGNEHPTLTQAKNLAKQYRVPFAYFYLPDKPRKIKRLERTDYRTFGNSGIGEMSRELRWFLRDIEERRDIMVELYRESEMAVNRFDLCMSMHTEEETFAAQIRHLMSLTQPVQIKFRKPETALSYCILKLEEQGFLIFQAAKIFPEEMRGLSIAYDVFPIIALNRKDEPSARLFTLVHELVHIVSRTSGICNNIGKGDTNINKIEMFCNKIAGLALVPTQQLKNNKNMILIRQYGIDDTYINAIARDFAVSREVILHRLWDIEVIERATYFDTLKRYSEEYEAHKKSKKESGFMSPALDKGTQVGKLYARTVMMAYNSDRLSPLETSNYLLGLHIKHFEAIERWCH